MPEPPEERATSAAARREGGGAGLGRRLPPPSEPGARTYPAARRVRLGDVRPSGRVRLDAVARYLQDVAADDVRDAGAEAEWRWVVRRTEVEVSARPTYEQPVDLLTWCSGTGAAWAERRTTVSQAGSPVIEACSVWVSLDPATLRPSPLDGRFFELYGAAAGGRAVRSRLTHGDPPEGLAFRRWPLRDCDFDVLGHVNNAVAWTVVEEEVRRAAPRTSVAHAEVEYRHPLDAGGELAVVSEADGARVRVWMGPAGGPVSVSAVVRTVAGAATAGPPPR